MQNPFAITETYELLQLVELIKPPASYLTDTFFSNKIVTTSDIMAVEFIKNKRRLAPFVSKGGRPLNVVREGSDVAFYKPSLIGAKRVISLEEISRRLPGEQPVFSTTSPEERANQLQGRDMKDLLNMIQNRREAMAAELLQTGKVTISGYTEDAREAEVESVDFGNAPTTKNWTQETATIYEDLKAASESIQETSGAIPTLCVVGKNVEAYLLKNKFFKQFMFSANPNATAFVNFKPRYSTAQTRPLGFIPPLNLEIVSYFVTYVDDSGQVVPFVDDDAVIIGIPHSGKSLFGAVTLLDAGGNWSTYAAENVPFYNFNTDAQAVSLSLYSRFLPCPNVITDWKCLKVGS